MLFQQAISLIQLEYFIPNSSPFFSFLSEAMSAPYARELGRLVYKYGGEPVASFLPSPSNPVLKNTTTNALFMDATHDNDPGHILVSHTHHK